MYEMMEKSASWQLERGYVKRNQRKESAMQRMWNSSSIRIHTNLFLLLFGMASVSLLNHTEAGFACLSNPCVYGVCIDDLNR